MPTRIHKTNKSITDKRHAGERVVAWTDGSSSSGGSSSSSGETWRVGRNGWRKIVAAYSSSMD